MSAEFWAVIGTAVAILVAIGAQHRDLHVRLDRIEARIDRVESRIDRLEARIERLEQRVEGLAERLSRLEGHFDELRAWVQGPTRGTRPPAA
ncbi:MAG TPA: hypothetical protein VK009_12790 [Chloroflexota bacterium]|nr:hypothetical protein [Chloroflexota bacterium]